MRLGLGLGLAMTFAASLATAAPTDGERLFREGRAAMQANDYATACTRFAESLSKEPAPGTALNLGDCEEKRGHLIAARNAFTTAAASFSLADKKKYATGRAEAVDKRIPTIVIRASMPPLGLRVALADGTPAEIDKEMRIDPGEVTVIAQAPGHKTKTVKGTAKEGQTTEIQTGLLDSESGAPPVVAPNPFVKNEPPPPAERPATNAQRTAGWIVIGVGAASLLVGGITGVMTLDRASTVEDHCDGNLACDSEGADAARSGSTLSTISTITVIGGLAAVAGGTLLVLTSPSKKTALAPSFSPSSAGLALTRSF